MLPFCSEMCVINYSCFDLFPNLNTVQNLPNFLFNKISLNTLNIPSIWDAEKSNDSPQRIITDGNFMLSSKKIRGTQQTVSVNYLFGRPLIPYNVLKGIFTSSLRDMGNLRPSVFGLIKMSFRVPKKGQLRFSERK